MQISERMIKQVASKRFPGGPVLVVKQAVSEKIAQIRTQMSFRHRENENALRAYSAMSLEEFEGINARQAWSNWRTVPRNLNGQILDRPLFAVDLCCGTGQSTSVLAWYLPRGSRILGLEFNDRFVDIARQRVYEDQRGNVVDATFSAQSVLESFRDEDGGALTAGSVDLVNCCGAVGHHFDAAATSRLADQLGRVIRSGGLALIDSGPHGTSRPQLEAIMTGRGFEAIGSARSCAIDRYVQVCFKRR